MAVGERIKQARKKAGLTQQELANALGVKYQMIGQYENGKRNPKLQTILKIAQALEVGLFDLISEEEYETLLDLRVKERIQNELDSGKIRIIESDEQRLVNSFSKLNKAGKDKVIEYTEDLAGNLEYQSAN